MPRNMALLSISTFNLDKAVNSRSKYSKKTVYRSQISSPSTSSQGPSHNLKISRHGVILQLSRLDVTLELTRHTKSVQATIYCYLKRTRTTYQAIQQVSIRSV